VCPSYLLNPLIPVLISFSFFTVPQLPPEARCFWTSSVGSYPYDQSRYLPPSHLPSSGTGATSPVSKNLRFSDLHSEFDTRGIIFPFFVYIAFSFLVEQSLGSSSCPFSFFFYQRLASYLPHFFLLRVFFVVSLLCPFPPSGQ